jgi:hypothetical protein
LKVNHACGGKSGQKGTGSLETNRHRQPDNIKGILNKQDLCEVNSNDSGYVSGKEFHD